MNDCHIFTRELFRRRSLPRTPRQHEPPTCLNLNIPVPQNGISLIAWKYFNNISILCLCNIDSISITLILKLYLCDILIHQWIFGNFGELFLSMLCITKYKQLSKPAFWSINLGWHLEHPNRYMFHLFQKWESFSKVRMKTIANVSKFSFYQKVSHQTTHPHQMVSSAKPHHIKLLSLLWF